MEHPFAPDLSEKSLEELQTEMSSLMNKLTYAYRTGNSPLIHQIQMMIDSYRTQYDKKMDEIFSKQKISSQINIQSQSSVE